MPYLEIDSIDRNGLMIIRFSEPMEVLDSSNDLKTEVFEIDGELRNIFEISVEPITELEQLSEQVAFDWTIAEFTSTELKIQLNFDEPNQISSLSEPNIIQVTIFRSKDFFERHKDGFLIEVPAKLEANLPRMITKEQVERVASAASLVSRVGKSTLWFTVAQRMLF